MTKQAILSDCQRYRYRLVRQWMGSAGAANFIMLNPSTADDVFDDPTIRRCIGFSQRWGYSSLIVTNLFAWRATDRSEIGGAGIEPIGAENNDHIVTAAQEASQIVLAWGAGPTEKDDPLRRMQSRVDEVLRLLAGFPVYRLGLTKGGMPRHPLYLPGASERVPFHPQGNPVARSGKS